jgi:hypothetical protein
MHRNGLESISDGVLAIAAVIVEVGLPHLTPYAELAPLGHALAGILLGFGYFRLRPCRRRQAWRDDSSPPPAG